MCLLLLLSLMLAGNPRVSCLDEKYIIASRNARNYLYRSTSTEASTAPIIDYTLPKDTTQRNAEGELEIEKPSFLYSKNTKFHRVVEFYSPTCPHCRHFAPKYIEFARHMDNVTQHDPRYANADIPIRFFAVSCLAHRPLCQQVKITRYPSVFTIPRGKAIGDIARRIPVNQLHPFTLLKDLGIEAVDDKWGEEKTQTENERQELLGKKFQQNVLAKLGISDTTSPFLHRTPQELFSDAYVSFHAAMSTSVFMEAGPLSETRRRVLTRWLVLLKKTLPAWRRIHSLVDALIFDFNDKVDQEAEWMAQLEKFPPPQKDWSQACRGPEGESGYTCGLWTLFHIMTVGAVEYNSNAINKEAEYLRTQQVADTLKDYIEIFFTCEECSSHFVKEYEVCSYKRCERLTNDIGNFTSWQQLPLWLLDTHNGVNVRLQRERTDRLRFNSPTLIKEQKRTQWPPFVDCPACWNNQEDTSVTSIEERSYNATMMYRYMRFVYWPEDATSAAIRAERFQGSHTKDERILSGSVEVQYILITLVVCALLAWNKKKVERLLGIGSDQPKGNSKNQPPVIRSAI